MYLIESIEVWKIRNPDTDYLDSVEMDSRLDKALLMDLLLSEYSEMDVVNTNSIAMHTAVENLFKKYKDNIKRLLDTLDLEYNPIDNYKTVEKRTLGITESENKGNNYSGEDTKYVSAYNQLDNSDTKERRDVSETDEYSTSEGNTNEDETILKTGMVNGNYQDLISKERELAKFNIYNYILQIFAKELLIAQW